MIRPRPWSKAESSAGVTEPTSLTVSFQPSHSVVSKSWQPHGLQPAGPSGYAISQARALEWVAILSPKERSIAQRKREMGRKNLHVCVVSYFCTIFGDVKLPFRLHEASITLKSPTTPGISYCFFSSAFLQESSYSLSWIYI